MALKIISLRVPVEVLHACGVAAAAAGCSRSAWMVRALESALGCAGEGDVAGTPALAPRDRVPSRASGPIRATTLTARLERQRKLNADKEKRA